jgi:two-component system, NtrC family, response regulator AtoC
MPEIFTKQTTKIFVLEDDLWYSKFLANRLELNPDHEVEVFETGDQLINRLNEGPDIITLDYFLPNYACEKILSKILEISPKTYTIIVSGQEDISKAVNLIKEGAFDYVVKNHETKDRLWSIVEKIKEQIALNKEIKKLTREVKQKPTFTTELIGNCEPMQKVYELVEKAAQSNINVTITGETGTGKELIAKAIHNNSLRSHRPFVAVNISAIPSELLESELFGHEKGAFTGATNRRIGKFEEASGGTLFLDEIGEMNINLQAKILRVVQEREMTRIGSNSVISIDVRLLTATHRNLTEEIRKGTFREDLYYRLLGIQIQLPRLRERGNDILLIAEKILRDYCQQNNIRPKTLSAEAQKKLLHYPFPGNVRELKALIELATILSDKDVIAADHIQLPKQEIYQEQEEKTLDKVMAETVQRYLNKYNYNVLDVADKLKIGKSTIYRMIQRKEVFLTNHQP